MILRFKAKENRGKIKVPKNLGVHHIVSSETYNKMEFIIQLRKIFKEKPYLKWPNILDLNDLPPHIEADRGPFLTIITIDLTK